MRYENGDFGEYLGNVLSRYFHGRDAPCLNPYRCRENRHGNSSEEVLVFYGYFTIVQGAVSTSHGVCGTLIIVWGGMLSYNMCYAVLYV